MSAHSNRLGLYIPWALFALFCLGWTAYWFVAKDTAIKALDAQIARANAAGAPAGYQSMRASGYPLRLTLTLSEARFAPTPGLAFEANTLPVSINLSNPRHIIVGLADGFSWRTADQALHELTAREGEMSVRFASDNTLARASLDLEGVSVGHDCPPGLMCWAPLPGSQVEKLLLHVRPDPRDAADSQLVIEATDWRGLTPFEALNDLGPFGHFKAAVVVTESATLVSHTPLQSWTGALRIERFDVAYGDAAVTGDGALQLDAAHRPEGQLNLTPAGAPVAVPLIARDGWWSFAGLRVAPARPLWRDAP